MARADGLRTMEPFYPKGKAKGKGRAAPCARTTTFTCTSIQTDAILIMEDSATQPDATNALNQQLYILVRATCPQAVLQTLHRHQYPRRHWSSQWTLHSQQATAAHRAPILSTIPGLQRSRHGTENQDRSHAHAHIETIEIGATL